MTKLSKGLKAWLPKKAKNQKCFFGTDLSQDWKNGHNAGRQNLNSFFGSLTLWERLKIAWRGYILK